jgi:pyruvate dehydrogenase E2 component (dihydrolipoamide acetyltransferase)
VPEGTQDVPVNQLIAVLAEEGEDVKTAAAGAEKSAASAAKPAVKPASAPAPVASAEKRPEAIPQDGASTRAQGQIPAPGEGANALAKGDAPGAVARGSERVFSSPLARRLARDAGIDLARVQGSGPHGRIIARDVEAAKSGKGLVAPAAIAPAGAPLAIQAPADDKIRALFEPGSYEVVPHDNIRKVIARRLLEAKLTIPHFYLTVDCNIDKLLAAREEINAAAGKDKEGKPGYKISVNDFVIKALALALQRVPDANVTWTEGAMLRHRHSDIGVAVSIPGGLITPVIRKAEQKSLSAISNEMKDFAARARRRTCWRGCSLSECRMGSIKPWWSRMSAVQADPSGPTR